MRLLHCSDAHLLTAFTGVPLRAWLGKRLLGLANLRLRRRRHFAGGELKIAALARLVEAEKMSAVIFTGDYTTLGTEVELANARRRFAPLIAASPVFVGLPGNHDLYLADSLRRRSFERYFGNELVSDLPEYCRDGVWPLVRMVGEEAAVVALNSARPNPQLWRSSGVIPAAQLGALAAMLSDRRVAERFVVVATHYAPRLEDGRPDRRTHGLINAEALLATVADLPRGVVLHGHVHRCYAQRVPGVRPWLMNAGSVTYAGREGCWVIEVEDGKARARRGRWLPTNAGAGRWRLDEQTAIELG